MNGDPWKENKGGFYTSILNWFQLRLLLVNWEYLVDSLSGIMLVIIALISLNVNVYSVDLLDVDTHQEQFIWFLAIFAIWITVFVMSNNLIVLFFCWELVGLCSYLLISFWKERQQSVKCSFKAILYNKVGDISLLTAQQGVYDLKSYKNVTYPTLHRDMWLR